MLDRIVLAVGTGQPGDLGLDIRDLAPLIQEIGGARAVGADELDEGLADIAVTRTGAFKTHVLENGRRILFGVDDRVAGLEFAFLPQRFQLVEGVEIDPRAVVQVFGMSRGRDRDDVGGVIGEQEKAVLLAGQFFDHSNYPWFGYDVLMRGK